MKRFFVAGSVLLFFLLSSFRERRGGVTGIVFPDISGVTLSDKKVSIPKDTKGKSTIIALAYSQDAEKELKTWAEPTYEKFIAKSQLIAYDINLYFIPMFSGAKIAWAESARQKFKKENDPELHPYVLIYKGELDKYKTALQMNKKDTPYLFVLDKDGKVVYSATGFYTEEKMDAIEDHLD